MAWEPFLEPFSHILLSLTPLPGCAAGSRQGTGGSGVVGNGVEREWSYPFTRKLTSHSFTPWKPYLPRCHHEKKPYGWVVWEEGSKWHPHSSVPDQQGCPELLLAPCPLEELWEGADSVLLDPQTHWGDKVQDGKSGCGDAEGRRDELAFIEHLWCARHCANHIYICYLL